MRRLLLMSASFLVLIALGLPLTACEEERDIPPPPNAESEPKEETPAERRTTGDLRESGNATIGKATQTAEKTVGELERRSREIADGDDE